MRSSILATAMFTMCFSAACGGGDDTGGDEPIPNLSVQGTVLDFETGAPLESAATVITSGLAAEPSVSVDGSDFTIENVLPFSVFHILAGSPPDYRSTYNVATVVEGADLTGVEVSVVSETYLQSLAPAFGVTATPGTSILIAQLIDDSGAPQAGIPAAAFQLSGTTIGPFFLDADRLPDANAVETSTSGYVVLFDVPVGLVSLAAAADSGYTMSMPDSPTAATAATLSSIVVTLGDTIVLPKNVSFANDISPIFTRRGCVLCHDGGGIGKDLGGLHLNGAPEKMYKELTVELSPVRAILRVDVAVPEASLMLTMPSREDPPDVHPNVTFASAADPDYLMILAWIAEGALEN